MAQRYAGALVVSAAALWTSVTLGAVIGRAAFVVFHIAVVVVAFCWGLGPALLTSGIGIVSVDYFLLGTPTSFRIESASDFIILLAYSVAAVITSALAQHLRAARSRAEHLTAVADRANAAKSQFLATMSHEIRTPINAVLGFAELLDAGIGGSLTEAQREYVQRIMASTRHLNGLVSDVLDLAKIEAGRVAIAARPNQLDVAAKHAVSLVKPLADSRHLELEMRECDAGLDTWYAGDARRVEQILVNLLSNAIKFTSRGGRVTVTCATVRISAGLSDLRPVAPGQWICARVEDTGCGIALPQLEQIFDPFVQVRTGLSDRAPGSGLGLAISRHLARLMGGDLTVESTLGLGSTFTLWLPALVTNGASARLAATTRSQTGDDDRTETVNGAGAIGEAMRVGEWGATRA